MKTKKNAIILLIVLFVIGFTYWFDTRPNLFHGWVTGLIPDDNGSLLVAVDPISSKVTKVLLLPQIEADQSGAVSPNKKYAAYTQWNEQRNNVYLNVQGLGVNGSKKTYFGSSEGLRITNLSWFPDDKRLLLIRTKQEAFPKQEICIFNLKDKTLKRLDVGGVWEGREYIGYENGRDIWKNHISQKKLNQLVQKYGGPRTIPIEECGRKLFVRFSSPAISPDGKNVAYSATLFQDFAVEGKNLWLGSSIWIADVSTGSTKRIYCNPTNSAAIGRVTWTSDKKKLIFYRYSGINGENGGLESFDLGSNQTDIVLPVNETHYTNLSALTLPNNDICFISVPKNGLEYSARQYIMNVNTGDIRTVKLKLGSQDMVLWDFSNLY